MIVAPARRWAHAWAKVTLVFNPKQSMTTVGNCAGMVRSVRIATCPPRWMVLKRRSTPPSRGMTRCPLEVAVVKTGKDDPVASFHGFLDDFEIHDVDVARVIFLRQTGAPEKIDHRPGELLVGFARQLGPLGRRERVAERCLEIAQRHPMIAPVEPGGKRADRLREPVTGFSRKKRDERGD